MEPGTYIAGREVLHPNKAEPAEDFEEMEEREIPVKEVKQKLKRAPQRQRFESKWSNFFLESIEQDYSLTTRRVIKPRVNLLCKNDYVVSRGALYQIQSDFPLPTIEPGYSVVNLMKQRVRAFKFVVLATARSATDRTRFAPEIIPSEIEIGEIQQFVNVYEPVGRNVEEVGIVLAPQAKLEMESQDYKCRVIPQSHRVKLQNKFVAKGESFVEAYAEELNKPAEFVQGKLEETATIEQLKKLVDNLKVEPIVQFVKKINKERSGQLMSLLREQNILFALINQKKNKVDFIDKIVKLNEDLNAKTAEQMIDFERELLQCVFNFSAQQSVIGDVLAASPELTQEQIQQVAENEAKARHIPVGALLNQYTQSIKLALMCKNIRFMNYIIYSWRGIPRRFGQLAQIALNSKLHAKDIKVSLTESKIFNVDFCPLAFAAFANSKAFFDIIDESKVNCSANSEQVNFITMGACANMKDDIEFVKRVEKKTGLNYSVGIIAALLAKNQRVLNFLMQKANFDDNDFLQFKKYLTKDHVEIISRNFKISPQLLKIISSKVEDEELLKLMKKIQIQLFNVYNGDLMGNLLINGHVQCANHLIRSGFCFARSQTNFEALAKISDVKLFTQITKTISRHYQQCDKDRAEVWAVFVIAQIQMRDVERIKLVQELFAMDRQAMLENSGVVVAGGFNNAKVNSLKFFEQVCKTMNMKLVNQFTTGTVDHIDFTEVAVDFDAVCDDYLDCVPRLSLRFMWQFELFRFAYEKIKNTTGEKQNKAMLHITLQALSAVSTQSKQTVGRTFAFQQAAFQKQPQNQLEFQKQASQLLDEIVKNKAALKAPIYNQQQFLQNEIAQQALVLSKEQFTTLLQNVDRTVVTTETVQQKEQVKANYLTDLKAKLNIAKGRQPQNEQIQLTNSTMRNEIRQKKEAEIPSLFNQTFFHFLNCSTSQLLLAKDCPELLAKTSRGECGLVPAIRNVRFQELQPVHFNELVLAIKALKNEEAETQSVFEVVSRLVSMQNDGALDHFLQCLNNEYQNSTPQLLTGRNYMGQNILHLVLCTDMVQSRDHVSDLLQEKLAELEAQQDIFLQTPAMVMASNMKQFVTKVGLHQELLDVEGNNVLHHILFNIDRLTNDQRDLQRRIEFLKDLSTLLDVPTLVQQKNSQGFTPLHFVCRSLDYLKHFTAMNINFAEMSETRSFFTGAQTEEVMQFLVDHMCDPFQLPPKVFDQNIYEQDCPFGGMFRACVASKKFGLINSLMERYPQNLMLTKCLVSTCSADAFQFLIKMKPVRDERLGQIFVNSLTTAIYNQVSTQLLKELAAKFYVFQATNKFKFVQEVNQQLMTNVVRAGLQIDADTFQRWMFTSYNQQPTFYSIMGQLLNKNNSDGLFQYLITTGIVDKNVMDADFHISKLAEKALSLQPKLEMVVLAYLVTVPAFRLNNANQYSSYKGFTKDLLHDYLLKQNKEEIQKMAVSAAVHWEGDEKAEQLFGKLEFKKDQIRMPEFQDYQIDPKLLEKMGQIYACRVVNTKAKTDFSQNPLFSVKNGVLCYKDTPLKLLGVRQINSKKYGYIILQVVQQGSSFLVKTQFVNQRLYEHSRHVDYRVTSEDRYATRKQKTVLQTQNPVEALNEFRKLLARKSEQTLEQIIHQQTTLEGMQSAKGFKFMLRDDVSFDVNDRNRDNSISELHAALHAAMQKKYQRTQIPQLQFLQHCGELHKMALCFRYREQIANLDQLSQQQLVNLVWRLYAFTQIPDEATDLKQEVRRIVRENSEEMLFMELLNSKNVDDITIEEMLALYKVGLERAKVLGLTGWMLVKTSNNRAPADQQVFVQQLNHHSIKNDKRLSLFTPKMLQGKYPYFMTKLDNGVASTYVTYSQGYSSNWSLTIFIEDSI